jgi:hypothetical protein
MQNYVYLVSHRHELSSNTIFYLIDDVYEYVNKRLLFLNEGVSENSLEYLKPESFNIYKLYIGQSFEGEIEPDNLEIV